MASIGHPSADSFDSLAAQWRHKRARHGSAGKAMAMRGESRRDGTAVIQPPKPKA